ncbi:MAG: response regulator [Bryobacteraceae bacterium]|jgi:PleD family two-component response regulator
MQKQPKKLLAAVGELFFTVKIGDAAKRAGLEVEFVKTDKDLLDKARQDQPVLIIFDLNFSAIQPLKVISKLKSSAELKSISLIGYLSHAQGELKQKAHEAGCNMVLARLAFSQSLPQILKRHSGTL